MSKPSLEAYKDKHAGRSVAVLGGGPSLPADIKRLPSDAVKISCNHHGARLTACDYTLFLDRWIDGELNKINGNVGLKLAPFVNQTDVLLIPDMWGGSYFAGGWATWIANYLGGNPIVLCGMDLYADAAQPYWHGQEPDDNTQRRHGDGEAQNVKMWRECYKQIRDCSKIKAMSGPLVEVFGEYIK